jgi:paraquat-inducible protein A
VLIWLNYSVQRRQTNLTQERIVLYRIAEFVGRWSMVDVYVVIILVSLIQLGNTMSIYPGGASLAFCGVVIVTMLAAMTFDSHLIFKTEANNEH